MKKSNKASVAYDRSHGSPYDRGSADSYYGRKRDPHKWPEGTYIGIRVGVENLTQGEIDAYNLGYESVGYDEQKQY